MKTSPPAHLLTLAALAANAVAQTGWVLRQPASQPPGRGWHAMTFDIIRSTTVMFGGRTDAGWTADTWEWDGLNWTQRITPHTPPARGNHALAADLLRGRVVLFGGRGAIGIMNDTWEFDGNDWAERQPANQPSLRYGAQMEYDVGRARTVLFGGGPINSTQPLNTDTWEWDGANWIQRTTATSPPPRLGHAMAYDFARSRIVLFGGSASPWLSDTWTWDGNNWTQMLVPPPTAAAWMGLAYHPARDLVVQFGNLSTGAETWLFDHVAWRRDPRNVAPAARYMCSLTHDLVRARTVLFGGSTGFAYFNDTWEYDPGTVARWTRFGSGCVGTSGPPTLGPVSGALPIVGTTFVLELLAVPGAVAAVSIGFSNVQWNGNTLPYGLGALGMTGCTLHVSPDVMFFAPATAGRATLAWALTNNTNLIGVTFFNQGFVLDPGINPVGATVSNAGAGIVGPF